MLEHTFNTHNELITHKQALIIVPTTEEGLLLQSLLGGKKKNPSETAIPSQGCLTLPDS